MLVAKPLATAALAFAATLLPLASQAATFAAIYSFKGGSDGAHPSAGLIYEGGALYGTTALGGMGSGAGTVFKIDVVTGAELVLHRFNGTSDGGYPEAGLTYLAGALYGTTIGNAFSGTVFKIDAATGAETVLHRFTGGTDGADPQAGLVYGGGFLYGTTQYGGATGCLAPEGCGTVFKIDPTTGTEIVLHRFAGGSDGEAPLAGLLYRNGVLYGTTYYGGTSDRGTVFRVNAVSGTETVMHSFTYGKDGGNPQAGLVYSSGYLYGTTRFGGTACAADDGCGAVFKVNALTGAETVLHSFTGQPDGARPMAGMIFEGGSLYGTTSIGGGPKCGAGPSEGCGTVFKVDPTTGAETVLYRFGGGADGADPFAGLTFQGGDFYGTTYYNGVPHAGTVFKLTP